MIKPEGVLKSFLTMTPETNVIKLFTAIIHHHSMKIPSFCIIKLY